MQAKSCGTQQISFLMPTLGEQQLDPRQPLTQLADQIPREQFELDNILAWCFFTFCGMARKLQVEYPGTIYHVMNRGANRWATSL
jgi:hypothetical protein